MTENRIKELVNKGFITKVSDIDDLMKMSELDLVKAGYITQVGIFDGEDDTEEEVPVVAPVVAPVEDDKNTPVVDDENTPVVDDKNTPVEDENVPVEDEDVPVEDESDAPVVDEGEE
jgi:hypothetical protein